MMLFRGNNICNVCDSHKKDHSNCQIKACEVGYWGKAERIVTEHVDRLICTVLFDSNMEKMREEARIYD